MIKILKQKNTRLCSLEDTGSALLLLVLGDHHPFHSCLLRVDDQPSMNVHLSIGFHLSFFSLSGLNKQASPPVEVAVALQLLLRLLLAPVCLVSALVADDGELAGLEGVDDHLGVPAQLATLPERVFKHSGVGRHLSARTGQWLCGGDAR